MNIREQVEEVSAQLLRGEISQAEALRKQREILGQPDPLPEPEPTPEPSAIEANASKATKIATALAKIQTQKADISAQLQGLKEKSAELSQERERLLGVVAASEQKLNIMVGSPTQYRNAKAEAIAAGLLNNTPVDVSAFNDENADLVDRLSATDLKAALQVLRQQMQEVERRKGAMTSKARSLTGDYFELHAREHGILFAQKASELVDEYCAVQAAHRANLNLGGFSQLASDSFSTLNIVSPLSNEDARDIGITRKEWTAGILETTTAIKNAQTALMSEMGI